MKTFKVVPLVHGDPTSCLRSSAHVLEGVHQRLGGRPLSYYLTCDGPPLRAYLGQHLYCSKPWLLYLAFERGERQVLDLTFLLQNPEGL